MTRHQAGMVRSRREFLRDVGVVGAAAAAATVLPGVPSRAGPATPGRAVAVFGAGVAGLSAAHELAERGYAVTVYERSQHLGGKAWSIPVPGSATGGRAPLMGEHGFRFFPGFYYNLGDTMRRTPLPGGGDAYDLLTRASTYRSSFVDRPDLTLPLSMPPDGLTPDTFAQSLMAAYVEARLLPANEAAYFANKLAVYVTSCEARRWGQWERTSWKDFIREEQMSAEYRKIASRSLVRNLAATKSDEASTQAIGLVGEATVLSIMGLGNDTHATVDRVLNGPTSEVWLDNWVRYLGSLGVSFNLGSELTSLSVGGGRISAATVTDGAGRSQPVRADHYICAVPCERMAPLVSPAILALDPGLAGIAKIKTDWMNGLVFFLTERFPVTNGHVNYVDSPFAVTSISQAQFWKRDLSQYGDGTVRDSFSTIISDWVTPGVLYGKTAKQCTPDEIAQEVWAQVTASLDDDGGPQLTDDLVHSWYLDPAILSPGTDQVANDTPLLIQDPGGWYNRPSSVTRIPNLFLAGDWVQTKIDVTTMDGANQGGRAAANGVLAASGYAGSPAAIQGLYVPPEFEPFRDADKVAYAAGQPNIFDPDRAKP